MSLVSFKAKGEGLARCGEDSMKTFPWAICEVWPGDAVVFCRLNTPRMGKSILGGSLKRSACYSETLP